jgi:hypothetical protein
VSAGHFVYGRDVKSFARILREILENDAKPAARNMLKSNPGATLGILRERTTAKRKNKQTGFVASVRRLNGKKV